MIQYFITLFVGMLIGGIVASNIWNRYYRSDIWSARKGVMLERLLAQKKDASREVAEHDLAISRMIDERMAERKPNG